MVFGSWSPARRVCCAEVAPEVDAAAEAILNTREKVVNEPLTSTRRLVSSLKQMWEEEALRCEVARDPSPMQGATPPSAAERRRALPAPPKYVASQLEKMAELLAGSTLARREAAAAAAAPTGGDDGDGDDDGGGGGGGGWAGGGESQNSSIGGRETQGGSQNRFDLGSQTWSEGGSVGGSQGCGPEPSLNLP